MSYMQNCMWFQVFRGELHREIIIRGAIHYYRICCRSLPLQRRCDYGGLSAFYGALMSRSCVWLKWRSSMPPQWPLAKSLRFKSSFRDSWLFWFSKGDSLRLGLCPGFVAAIAAWSSLTSQHHLSLLELSVGVCDKLCADSGFQAKEYGGYGSFLARRDLDHLHRNSSVICRWRWPKEAAICELFSVESLSSKITGFQL
ncbi:hypothetical protein Bca4012_005219 [Brassica carinata]